MKTIYAVIALSLALGATNASSAEEWWQFNNSTHECQPTSGNLSPYQLKTIIEENNGTFTFVYQGDKDKQYIFTTELDGRKGFISMAASYSGCVQLGDLLKKSDMLK